MRLRKIILAMVVTLAIPAALIASIGGYCYFTIDRESPLPMCHKQLGSALFNWLEKEKTDIAPNVNGRSDESLAVLAEELGDVDERQWPAKYRYVPGLQQGDPGDLVLAYFAKPTRYRHHASIARTFDERHWILIPLDFGDCGYLRTSGQRNRNWENSGECSDNVTLAEFKQRLQKTLDYLRDNDRLHWQTVVEEHTKFMDSIPKN